MADVDLFPNEKIIVTNLFDAHQDWYTPIPGFFILAPNRKIRSVSEFTDEEAIEFIKLLRSIRKGMKEALGIEDVYLFQREDTEGDFHLWIFPRHPWMERFGRKVQSIRPIMEFAKESMVDDETIKEVKECVRKMRRYMEDFQQKSDYR